MGLVALASRGLSGAKPQDILDLDANDVAKVSKQALLQHPFGLKRWPLVMRMYD